MNFAEFQEYRRGVRATDPDAIDLAETNHRVALADLVPALHDADPSHVHRCHLAENWVSTFGLPSAWAGRALVSSGVRHSLSLLLAAFAADRLELRIPQDVYPVYGRLAKAAGARFTTFRTLPGLALPEDGDVLLLPNPLKPTGRHLDPVEVEELRRWLEARPQRRLLLDAVYTFRARFDPSTLELVGTDQVILLHSLSKGWLHPQVFGVALVPEADRLRLGPSFRDAPPTQASQRAARELMLSHSHCPQRVAAELATRREAMCALLPAEVRGRMLPSTRMDPIGYLVPVQLEYRTLLERYRLVAIPASVFGSDRADWSVLSTLGQVYATRTVCTNPSQSEGV